MHKSKKHCLHMSTGTITTAFIDKMLMKCIIRSLISISTFITLFTPTHHVSFYYFPVGSSGTSLFFSPWAWLIFYVYKNKGAINKYFSVNVHSFLYRCQTCKSTRRMFSSAETVHIGNFGVIYQDEFKLCVKFMCKAS